MKTASQAIDPVCNRVVDTDTQFKSRYKGHDYYFCGVQDKAAFDKNPKQYMTASERTDKEGMGNEGNNW